MRRRTINLPLNIDIQKTMLSLIVDKHRLTLSFNVFPLIDSKHVMNYSWPAIVFRELLINIKNKKNKFLPLKNEKDNN